MFLPQLSCPSYTEEDGQAGGPKLLRVTWWCPHGSLGSYPPWKQGGRAEKKIFDSWPRRASVSAQQGERGAANARARPSWDHYQRKGGNELEGLWAGPYHLVRKGHPNLFDSPFRTAAAELPGLPSTCLQHPWAPVTGWPAGLFSDSTQGPSPPPCHPAYPLPL